MALQDQSADVNTKKLAVTEMISHFEKSNLQVVTEVKERPEKNNSRRMGNSVTN